MRTSKEIEHKIVISYQKLQSIRLVGATLGIPHPTVYQVLKRCGTAMRSQRTYFFNERFFEEIDTPEKAYFLGWLYADGNVHSTSNCISLKIHKDDGKVIEDFLRALEFQKKYEVPLVHNTYMNFMMSSSNVVKDLKKWGCVPAKTPHIRFPVWMKPELLPYFCRGHFEGDGWIYLGIRKRYSRGCCINFQWGISSNRQFVEGMKTSLNDLLGIKLLIHTKNGSNGISLETVNQNYLIKIIEFLYEESCFKTMLFLPRKRDKCLLAKNLILDKGLRQAWLLEREKEKAGVKYDKVSEGRR